MRNLYITLSMLLIASTLCLPKQVKAQSPEKMSYQALIRDINDDLVTNSPIGMQISILQGSVNGTVVYIEIQNPTSNDNGLVSIEIGGDNVAVIFGDFASIDWANGPCFVKTEIDPMGGSTYTITGTNQLLSVPYALHAKTAEIFTGSIIEVDGYITNEIQDLQLVGNILTITNNGTATEIEIDASVTNEVQDLQLVGNILTITNNGTATEIDLSTYLDNQEVSITEGNGITITGTYPDFVITNTGTGSTPTHHVGELIGTNGEDGVVFWVDHTGVHGLICSPENINGGTTAEWSDIAVAIVPGGAISNYNGYANTIAINNQSPNSAANLCLSYSTPGTSAGDWYLPAVDELSKIYHAKYEINKALDTNSFGFPYFWSSTELSFNYAWYYQMEIGYSNNNNKINSYMVRAIRAF